MASKRPIERPIPGFILSLLGGLFVTAGGVYGILNIGNYYYGYASYDVYSVISLVLGTALLVGAALLFLAPQYRIAWGVTILVFAVASLMTLYGPWAIFVFVGVPLALVGGSLAIAWKPLAGLGFEDYRTCLACGRHVRAHYPVCPFCGAHAGSAPPEPASPGAP
ncbi:MAG TPA: DUF6114 domain-containing protein [Thermoplasmata archaeon]|nr:DUF6114 domain-containing protein [Thermoplasmata archaeon]